MSRNSSSSSSDLVLMSGVFSHCFDNRVGKLIFAVFTVTTFLLVLPLSIITLFLGYQQWRRKHSTPTSHSDFFTFHMVVMEIVHIMASVGYCFAVYIHRRMMMGVMSYFFYSSSCAQMSFHTLTCVERFLAVVFPITYMRISKRSGVQVRNGLILLVWMVFFALLVTMVSKTIDVIFMLHTVQQACSLIVISFCSFAVLRVLKRSVPGDGGRDRERVDQLKQKAFNTIMAIMGALLLSFAGCLFYVAVYASPQIPKTDQCVILESTYWLTLPSRVVLPLLFLHRAGKLPWSRNS